MSQAEACMENPLQPSWSHNDVLAGDGTGAIMSTGQDQEHRATEKWHTDAASRLLYIFFNYLNYSLKVPHNCLTPKYGEKSRF